MYRTDARTDGSKVAGPLERLRELVATGEVLVVVGAGVSLAATGNAREASWKGLIESGIEQLEADRKPTGAVRALLDEGDLVFAAGKIRQQLGERGFALWLQRTVGRLAVTEPGVLRAIGRLNAPILTTNYDHLLESTLGREPATWTTPAAAHRVLQGSSTDILHIHGSWKYPLSVVFDGQSYQRLLDDSTNQALLRAAVATKHLLFIGVGGGLYDDNFTALREFVGTVLRDIPNDHYQLVRSADPQPDRDTLLDDAILRIGFDGDLAAWLAENLAPPPDPAQFSAVHRAPALPRLELVISRTTVTAGVDDAPDGLPVEHGLNPLTIETVRLFDELVRTSPLDPAADGPDEQRILRQMGRILFDAIFRGDVLDKYRRLRDAHRPFSISLDVRSERISLPDDDVLSVNIRDLPWELLYDKKAGPLAENSTVRLIRVNEPNDRLVWKPRPNLRVLIAASQPAEVVARMYREWPGGQTQYDAVIQRIVDAVRPGGDSDGAERLADPVTLAGLAAELDNAEQPYDVLHLIGHADALHGGKIAFAGAGAADGDGATVWEPFDEVENEFRRLVYGRNVPTLVFLHLCQGPRQQRTPPRDLMRASFTGLAYQLLTAGVPIVVAMQYPMSPDVGQQFTRAFYESVASHTVAEAVQRARLEIQPKTSRLGPVLFLGGPDGAIVELPRHDNRPPRTASATKVPVQRSVETRPAGPPARKQAPRSGSDFE